jgi:hypothetical protein
MKAEENETSKRKEENEQKIKNETKQEKEKLMLEYNFSTTKDIQGSLQKEIDSGKDISQVVKT